MSGLLNPANAGPLLLAALLIVGCGAILCAIAAQGMVSARANALRARLALIAPDAEAVEEGAALDEEGAATHQGIPLVRRLRRWYTGVGGVAALRVSLPLSAAAGGVVGGLAYHIFLSGMLIAALSGALAGLFLLQRRLKQAAIKRRVTFLEHLPEAIDLIVRVVQAGIPVTEAIAVAGKEAQEPVAGEFRAIAHRIQLGIDVKEVLLEAAERVNVLDFDCFVVSLIVQRETGGQISETLQNLAVIVRRRKDTRAKAKVLTAEGRLTANVIAGLPFFVGGVLSLLNPTYMSVLISHPTGRTMLLVSLGCIAAGMAVIGNITRTEI